MPVSASPARKSARNRPDLLKAGGREAGGNCQLPCAARAISAGCAAPRFLRNAATIVCASRIVTTPARAGSDDAQIAPVINDLRWLAQVTTPSDGLPDPSSSWIAQRDPSSCPLPAGAVQIRAEEAPLRALGQWLNSMDRLPTGKRHRRQERVQPWQATENSARIGSGVPSPL
jgi:hypothetical protein